MDLVPLTERGAKMMRDELKILKSKERPQIIQAIAEARAHGDLKENAEYHAAKDRQSFIEGRIKDLEGKLSNAQIIDVTQIKATGKVIFGATVELYAVKEATEVTYQIVGQDEANIKNGLLSITSPIARALIGKSEGDEVTVTTPSGKVDYEILSVRYV